MRQLLDILATNTPVPESQRPAVRSFLFHTRARKHRLDEKIAELRTTLEELCSERDALDTEIRKHAAALSPIRRVPPEILSHIFTFAVKKTRVHFSSRRHGASVQSAFWTSISNKVKTFHLPKLETLQARSGAALPLDVYFSSRDEDTLTEAEAETYDLLVQHSARWGSVYLSGSEELYTRIQRVGAPLPLLRNLEFDLYLVDQPDDSPLDAFRNAPRLQEASVNAGSEWSKLSVLFSAPNLVECALDLGSGAEPATLNAPILLPHLLRLSVSHRGLLRCLDTPILEELYYQDGDRNNSLTDLAFFHGLPRTLKTLVISAAADTTDIDFLGIVQALPSLTRLASTSEMPTDVVCRLLHTVAVAPPPTPTLEHFLTRWKQSTGRPPAVDYALLISFSFLPSGQISAQEQNNCFVGAWTSHL
ncbi:hypothetical protein FB45DRAFT_1029959 [Roridomyces roridus]|uniref:F-box domain-containing protein n=1 Tax=Roridomyces roridus TaxID=1738132 RepID=A0AAD7BMX0_9AGAR|nr:hypothetical protein FB45DRAFT_1029959 [Roridomyces roridus]